MRQLGKPGAASGFAFLAQIWHLYSEPEAWWQFMSRELICAWLKIPAEPWPPDPFVLLGLSPGETDRELIERHVHERMECVRRYQLAHPEEVTEVMNCLAQAFNDLCQPKPEAKPRSLPVSLKVRR